MKAIYRHDKQNRANQPSETPILDGILAAVVVVTIVAGLGWFLTQMVLPEMGPRCPQPGTHDCFFGGR